MIALTLGSCEPAVADAPEPTTEGQPTFRLELPEWIPDPDSLPEGLRPLEIERPSLPQDVASELAEIEARIAVLEQVGLAGETRDEQDAALDEAIALAGQALDLRLRHQGPDTPAGRAWREHSEHDWWEVGDARRRLATLRQTLGLSGEARAALATLADAEVEFGRLYGARDYAAARAFTERNLELSREVLGDEHAQTLLTLGLLGLVLTDEGRLSEAEGSSREALQGLGVVLGEDHPHTLKLLNHLGFVLQGLGKLSEAEAYYRRALAGQRRVHGDDHTATLTTVNNLGHLLHARAKLEEAEGYHRQALAQFRRTLGDADPNTLISVNNLGGLLEARGKLAEAEKFYRQALTGLRRVMGRDHPYTLTLVNNLGYLLGVRGKLPEAEHELREALAGRRRLLGDEHPHTLAAMDNLGGLLLTQGKSSEAESYLREALAGHRRLWGDEHPDTLTSYSNLGSLLKSRGDLGEAEDHFRKALAGFRRVGGDEHPRTLATLNTLAGLLFSQGKTSEAEGYCLEALEKRRRILGNDHPDTLSSATSLASLFRSQGKLAEAEELYREALAGRRRLWGTDHPHTLGSMYNLGTLLEIKGELVEAERYLREALETAERLRTNVIGDEMSRAAYAGELHLSGIASHLAALLVETNRSADALTALERGRGRSGLDLLSRNVLDLGAVIAESGDDAAVARHAAAVRAEREALSSLREAEARMAAAENDASRVEWSKRVQQHRRQLAEKTAAVFAELRGLIPVADPMAAEKILSALAPGELIVSYVWTEDRVLALWADKNRVQGSVLAGGQEEVGRLARLAERVRHELSFPTPLDTSARDELARLSTAVFPSSLREAVGEARLVVISPDGPLRGVPIDPLIETADRKLAPNRGVAVSYAYSATAHLRKPQAPAAPRRGSGAVVLGGAIFERGDNDRSEPDGPEAGVLLSVVQPGSNAAQGGLQRGDVLVRYGEHTLSGPADLGPAIRASADLQSTSSVRVEAWREGRMVEAALKPGRMGVVPSQAPPREGLRSMRILDRAATGTLETEASALDLLRLFGGELRPLPGTEREAQVIASLAGDATLLLGDQATIGKLRERLEGSAHPPRFVHLATHGLLGSAARAGDAALALTRPDRPTADDIGFLTLDELTGRWHGRLAGCELVVLSACDTGQGIARGDTVFSLPLGFQAAGAETVVASLWKVDDTATALLMSRFYANLLGKVGADGEARRLPRLAALREAQSWLRSLSLQDRDRLTGASAEAILAAATRARPGADEAATDERPYDHPFYWAAFVLFGETD